MPQTALVPYCFHSAPLCQCICKCTFLLYFRLSLSCKMSYKLIYDRDSLYVMISLFKKEQRRKDASVGAFFSSASHHIFVCVR